MRKVCTSPPSRASGSRPVATLPLRAAERRHDCLGQGQLSRQEPALLATARGVRGVADGEIGDATHLLAATPAAEPHVFDEGDGARRRVGAVDHAQGHRLDTGLVAPAQIVDPVTPEPVTRQVGAEVIFGNHHLQRRRVAEALEHLDAADAQRLGDQPGVVRRWRAGRPRLGRAVHAPADARWRSLRPPPPPWVRREVTLQRDHAPPWGPLLSRRTQ